MAVKFVKYVGISFAVIVCTGCAYQSNQRHLSQPQNSYAQDPSAQDPYAYGGAYTGVGVGVGGGHLFQIVPVSAPVNRDQDLGIFGPSIYAQVGYDARISERVFGGVFVDVGKSREKHEYKNDGWGTADLKQRSKIGLGARLGAIVNSEQIWYVSGGLSEANYKFDIDAPSSSLHGSNSENLTGSFVGVGTQTRLRGPISLNLEARVDGYKRKSVYQSGGNSWTEKPTDLTLRAGVTYHYGAPPRPDCCSAQLSNSFEGGYVGGGLAYDAFTAFDDRNASGLSGEDFGFNKASGYIQAGYDHKLAPNWVGGVFADYTIGKKTAREYVRDIHITDKPDAALGLRAGYIAGANALIYATGGVSKHKLSVENTVQHIAKHDVNAWFGGIGTEARLYENLFIKLEYRMESLAGQRFEFPIGPAIHDVKDINRHGLRTGMSYRF